VWVAKKVWEVFAIKRQIGIFVLLESIVVLLSGCGASQGRSSDLTVIYGVAMALAVLLLAGYCTFVKNKAKLYVLLFFSVAVVNTGYFWLAISPTLEQALMANRLAYLGSVLLPLAMFLIIRRATNCQRNPTLFWVLLGISGAVFLIAASGGILEIYYKEVSLQVVNGVSSLKKVYGPLHPLYLLFLLGYFSAMVFTIIRAAVKKAIASPAHSVILAIAVFVNMTPVERFDYWVKGADEGTYSLLLNSDEKIYGGEGTLVTEEISTDSDSAEFPNRLRVNLPPMSIVMYKKNK
jgi:hypothetical protein